MYATQNVAKQSQDSKAAFVVLWHADDKLFISGQVCTGEQQGGWQKGILKLLLNSSLTLMRSPFCAGVMLEDTLRKRRKTRRYIECVHLKTKIAGQRSQVQFEAQLTMLR